MNHQIAYIILGVLLFFIAISLGYGFYIMNKKMKEVSKADYQSTKKSKSIMDDLEGTRKGDLLFDDEV